MRWLVVAMPTAVVAALGAATAAAIAGAPEQALAGGAGARWLQVGAATAACAAGMLLVQSQPRRAAGWWLAGCGPAILLAALPLPGSSGAAVFTAALAFGVLAPALTGAAALARGARADRLLAVAVAGVGLLGGVVPALLFDPVATGCFECPANLLLVHGDEPLRLDLLRVGLIATAVACALAAARTAWVWVRSPRGVLAALVLPLAGAAAAGTVLLAHGAAEGVLVHDGVARTWWLVLCGMVLVASAGVLVGAVRARVLRTRVRDLVLETLPDAAQLRAALAASAGDARLELTFRTHEGVCITADGQQADPPAPGSVVTVVRRRGEPVADVRHVAATAERVRAATLGAAPALEHAAMRARARAELRELEASRARVVEAAGEERRRLERDLHDGAQQRLIALALAIEDPAARADLRAALQELRDLAHGIHPVLLTDAGLEASLRALADGASVPVRIAAAPSARLPAAVEAATHRLVADAVLCATRDGNGRTIEVEVADGGGRLRAVIRLPAVDPRDAAVRLRDSADRLEALGGSLEIRPGTVVEGSLPCAS